MSAAEYVFDPVDFARGDAQASSIGRGVLDQGSCSPTSVGVGAPSARLVPEALKGGGMTKSNIRSLAYFLIVGGVVVWVVGHLAPIRA